MGTGRGRGRGGGVLKKDQRVARADGPDLVEDVDLDAAIAAAVGLVGVGDEGFGVGDATGFEKFGGDAVFPEVGEEGGGAFPAELEVAFL